MKLNKYLWDIYKQSEQGILTINDFRNLDIEKIVEKHLGEFNLSESDTTDFIFDCINFISKPQIPENLSIETAEQLFNEVTDNGFELRYNVGEEEKYDSDSTLGLIPVLSMWLYAIFPEYYFPYFYTKRFVLLTKIADAFEISLPEVPPKKNKIDRIKYYWKLCVVFNEFRDAHGLTYSELCAFLYDFAPNYVNGIREYKNELPKPTQTWIVGGNKNKNGDIEFLDGASDSDTHFWQGNIDTKRGDIIIMYCLAPQSSIHSIWRATKDGIADPFSFYYSSIEIGNPLKVKPIRLAELKENSYFRNNSLVRANMQGISGYAFNNSDYEALLLILKEKGEDIVRLPFLYAPKFDMNSDITNEREVEIALVEPLIERLGYSTSDWIRQLPVGMGRGERNFPDYAFLFNQHRGYESASMLIECKFWVKNNREHEDAFKQVWSYGQRLTATAIVIADKDAIWVYNRHGDSFDRTKYFKKFWKELEQVDEFNNLMKLIGKQVIAKNVNSK